MLLFRYFFFHLLLFFSSFSPLFFFFAHQPMIEVSTSSTKKYYFFFRFLVCRAFLTEKPIDYLHSRRLKLDTVLVLLFYFLSIQPTHISIAFFHPSAVLLELVSKLAQEDGQDGIWTIGRRSKIQGGQQKSQTVTPDRAFCQTSLYLLSSFSLSWFFLLSLNSVDVVLYLSQVQLARAHRPGWKRTRNPLDQQQKSQQIHRAPPFLFCLNSRGRWHSINSSVLLSADIFFCVYGDAWSTTTRWPAPFLLI